MWNTIVHIFPYAIALAMPLLITSLGGLFSERSGVVNIGLEGLMVVGGFASAAATVGLEPSLGGAAIWVSLLIAMVIGALFSVLHAFASINLNANQVISGTAINMIAGAVTVFLARTITGSGNIQLTNGIPRFDVPGLVDIPLIGKLFFYQTYGTTWLILAILALGAFVLYKTAFGLRLRACGEHPHAADAAGINVFKVRYGAVMISGALAGLGGATILVTYSGEFSGSVAGMGFLALAALIFGQWKPLGVLGATFFFGFAATLANASQAEPALQAIPEVILKVFPYVVTLLALILFSKSTQAPRAAGEPFEKGKR
ncbi:MAG: ABC transporter permease [Propionivibrio sp.]|nr:ABC transporter permease [Propionivibrio sp.]